MFACASISARSAPAAPWRAASNTGVIPPSGKFDVEARGGQPLRQVVPRRLCVQVRAGRDQRARDFRPIVRGRVHQRRLPLPALDDVDVRAALDQEPHGGDTVRARREHQRRLALGQRAIDFGAGVEQCTDQRGVRDERRLVERRDAVAVRGVRVGAGVEQRAYRAVGP